MEDRNTSNWDLVRKDYPGLERGTYVDTSSCGLIARSTEEAARKEQERLMMEGSARFMHWHGKGKADVVGLVARHVGGNASGMALLQNFTGGMARLAPMLKHRRKVLLVGGDYPTLHAPFKWNGFDIVAVEPAADGTIPMDVLAAAIQRERPQLVAISHVQWQTGFMIDLHALTELCRAHGTWSVVDITQSWCSVPIDLRRTPVDIVGSSGYKWPLAGFGNGFFHLSETVRTELSEKNGFDPIGALCEGHLDPIALVRLSDAVERSLAIGADAVRERLLQLCDLAVDQLQKAGVRVLNGTDPATRGGILIIEGDEKHLTKMREAGVQAQLRGAGIRIGIHFYNDEEDVERLVKALTSK
ncbi:MAG: aminotransferase class V-fold PLP-dependent enzyme [Flavobacteriales bacterium]|nr:aminotransferase class V-fold PLP-dependent enzyme [Flavobacteriales bacterium]